MTPTALLFDLDGTIADSAPGIIACVQQTLRELGRVSPPAQDLRWLIGPPVRQTFAELLGGEDGVESAVALYRTIYAERGLPQTQAFDGIAQALRRLQADGHPLFVCTSKMTSFAEALTQAFGIRNLFVAVYGASPEGQDHKPDLVARILADHGLAPTRSCMIGDRREDIAAGRAHGLPTLGVRWGYASPGELEEAGASAICQIPAALVGDLQALLAS